MKFVIFRKREKIWEFNFRADLEQIFLGRFEALVEPLHHFVDGQTLTIRFVLYYFYLIVNCTPCRPSARWLLRAPDVVSSDYPSVNDYKSCLLGMIVRRVFGKSDFITNRSDKYMIITRCAATVQLNIFNILGLI